MELTTEDKAVLAHVVVDPDAWVAHALATVGEWAVTAKIKRWKPEYLAQKDLPDYRNRVERDAFEVAEREANKPVPTYADLRRADYPSIEEINVALWELVVEGRQEAAADLQIKRLAVKERIPKT